MATGAAWLNGNRLTERRKKKCALTSSGLLMEGVKLSGALMSCSRAVDLLLRTVSEYGSNQELEGLSPPTLDWRSHPRFSTIPLWLSLFSFEASMLAGIGRFAQAYSQEN